MHEINPSKRNNKHIIHSKTVLTFFSMLFFIIAYPCTASDKLTYSDYNVDSVCMFESARIYDALKRIMHASDDKIKIIDLQEMTHEYKDDQLSVEYKVADKRFTSLYYDIITLNENYFRSNQQNKNYFIDRFHINRTKLMSINNPNKIELQCDNTILTMYFNNQDLEKVTIYISY